MHRLHSMFNLLTKDKGGGKKKFYHKIFLNTDGDKENVVVMVNI